MSVVVRRSCDVCGHQGDDVLRYGLTRQQPARDGRSNTTWGAGGIDLCASCWQRIGAPKTRPARVTKRVLRELLPTGGFRDYMERAVSPRRTG